MAISVDDFQNMKLGYNRAIRTADSEQYILFSDDSDAGFELHEEAPHASRVGHLIIQYASNPLSQPFVSGTLILEAEWEQEAVTALIGKPDHEIVSSIGAGSKHQRETFDVEVFILEQSRRMMVSCSLPANGGEHIELFRKADLKMLE